MASLILMIQMGQAVLRVKGPFCPSCSYSDVKFPVFSAQTGEQVGLITKQWAGFAQEVKTNDKLSPFHQWSSLMAVGLHCRWQLRNQLPARPGCEGNLVDFYNVILFWTISFILGESHLAGSIILNWLHVLWDSKSEPGQPLLDIEYWTFWYTYIGRWAFWYFLNYFKCVAI